MAGRSLVLAAVAMAALTLPLLVPVGAVHSIDDFGAIANVESTDAALANGAAWAAALSAAQADPPGADRTVLVPAGNVYAFLPAQIAVGLANVTVRIDGTLSAYTANLTAWPPMPSAFRRALLPARHDDDNTDGSRSGGDGADRKDYMTMIGFVECSALTVTGAGVVDGNGYPWWWIVITTGVDGRPNMFDFAACQGLTVSGLHLRNSMQYHLNVRDSLDVLVEGVDIYVDVEAQERLLESAGRLMPHPLAKSLPVGQVRGIPTFPLNTDGIDVGGARIVVRNCTVLNFDDSVCIKPTNGGGVYTNCSQDMLVEDVVIREGVGASVGSVPPNANVNCIRNITFRRVTFFHPIKAIYIKPNPGDSGTGVIDNVTYEDIYAEGPQWWSIWVSTQQQDQPGPSGAKTGCSFFYPIDGTQCPTQPRVPVTRLTLRNVTVVNALLSPGVLRCNETNPCSGWQFDNVHMSSVSDWPVAGGFLCENVVGSTWTNTSPMPNCTVTTGSEDADSAVHKTRLSGINPAV
jgi:polygalacturonase